MKYFSQVHPIFFLFLFLLASCKKEAAKPRPSESPKSSEPAVETTSEGAVKNGSSSATTERHQYLELIVQNNTSGDIDEVAVVLSKNICTFGVVGMGVSKG